jgi:hypothetical protein
MATVTTMQSTTAMVTTTNDDNIVDENGYDGDAIDDDNAGI